MVVRIQPMKRGAGIGLLAALMLAGIAPAAAMPQPRKPVGLTFFTGRWYEIARTNNDRQRDCQAPTYQFEPGKASTASLTLTCRKGSPAGPPDRLKVAIRIPEGARNKFKVTALAGLISQEYWVLDIADDESWSVLATPGGDLVWLLARRPALEPQVQSGVLNSIRGMGYDLNKIVMPRHG